MLNGIDPQRGNVRKYKNIPFFWEQDNYLLKMKQDSNFLTLSYFQNYFNFSTKSDPFLVFPSTKHNINAQGSGANALKKLKNQQAIGKP